MLQYQAIKRSYSTDTCIILDVVRIYTSGTVYFRMYCVHAWIMLCTLLWATMY